MRVLSLVVAGVVFAAPAMAEDKDATTGSEKIAGQLNPIKRPSLHHLSGLGKYYAIGAGLCALGGILGTAVALARERELTSEEALAIIAGCALPIVGPLIVHHFHPNWSGPRLDRDTSDLMKMGIGVR